MSKLANWQTGKSEWMRWLFSCLLICQFASLPVSAARADDPVVLKATLSEGRVLRYDVNARLELKSGSQAEAEVLEQKLRLRFTVARVDKDGALIRGRLESAKVHFRSPGSDAADFEWKEGDAAGPEEEPPLAQMYRQLVGTIFELSLDEKGAIDSVSGLDRVAGAGKGLANPTRVMGILAPEAAARMLQAMFTLDPDGRPHKPGESWSFTQDVGAGVWMTKAKTEYTLKDFSDGVAKITGSTTVTPRPMRPGEADLRPRMEIVSQSVKIDATWDTREGRLVGRTIDGKVVSKGTVAVKQPIEATSTSTSRIVFTWVGAGQDPKK